MLYDIEILIDGRDLNEQHAYDLMKTLIASGTDLEKTVFLLAVHMKGMIGQELTGYANAVRSEAKIGPIPDTSDIVGTGGDGMHTINVSTAASILCAGMGIRMAKHGNRAITSPQGSADILARMNYRFEKSQEELENHLEGTNFAFMLAPYYNDAFAKFFPARKMLTFKTVMNYMGPITNPADPERLVIGTSDPATCDLYADYLSIRRKKGFIVNASDGMDEISPISKTRVIMVDGSRKELIIDPKEIGIPAMKYENITFPDPEKNRHMLQEGLFGRDDHVAGFIALNASPVLVLNGAASSLEEGYRLAVKEIRAGTGRKSFKKISGGLDRLA